MKNVDMLSIHRAKHFISLGKGIGIFLIIGCLNFLFISCTKESKSQEYVRIGVLLSLTGSSSIEDKPIFEALSMAIDEVNEKGGLLGYTLKVVTYDTASEYGNYAIGARELIERDKVVVIFSCGDSAARRSARQIIEEHESIMIYPLAYEGGGLSRNIVYVGPAPNQQVIPAVVWAMNNLGHRFFLVGTDEIYSHVVHAIIKDLIYALNGEVVGEDYVPVEENSNFDSIIDHITGSRPDVILNTIEGVTNLKFIKSLREFGINSNDIPMVAFDFTENSLKQLSAISMEGDYSVWSYFQTIDSASNEEFMEKFFAKYGKGRAIDDPMQSMYIGFNLWAQAVREAGSFSSAKVLRGIENQSYVGPSGLIYMDPDTHGAYRPVRIGKVQDKQFKIIWDSHMSVVPVQYTIFRTPQEWDELINDLYEKWGKQWFRSKE